MRPEGDQEGSVAVPTSHGKIIYPQHAHSSIWRGRNGTQVTQQGWCLHFHPEPWSQALIHLSTGGEPQCFQLFQEAVAHPCPGLDEIRKPFSKHLPLAARHAAKELAHTEPQDDATAPARHI